MLGAHLSERHCLLLGSRQDGDNEATRQRRWHLIVVVGRYASTRGGGGGGGSVGAEARIHQDIVDVSAAQMIPRRRHDTVDGLTDDLAIPQGVPAHGLRHLLTHVVSHIVQLDLDAPLLTIRDPRQHLHVLGHHVAQVVLRLKILEEARELLDGRVVQ